MNIYAYKHDRTNARRTSTLIHKHAYKHTHIHTHTHTHTFAHRQTHHIYTGGNMCVRRTHNSWLVKHKNTLTQCD